MFNTVGCSTNWTVGTKVVELLIVRKQKMAGLLKRTKAIGSARQVRQRRLVEVTVDGAALGTLLPSDARANLASARSNSKHKTIGKDTRRAQMATLEAALKRIKSQAQLHPPRNLGDHKKTIDALSRELDRLKRQQHPS